MKILVNFPTRSRPEKFREVVSMWIDPLVQIVATIDRDDASMNNADMLAWCRERGIEVQVIEPAGKIAAMNAGVAERDFDIVIVGQDDLEPRPHYAQRITALWQKHFGESTDGILNLHDGFRADNLCTIVIMGRQYFDRFGFIYHPSYKALWCDNEMTDVAMKLNRIVNIHRRIITHEWAGHNPDALLAHNERFYDEDKATYNRRKGLGFPLEAVPA